MDLARGDTCIHAQHRHTVLEEGIVQHAQIREIEGKPKAVGQARQEARDRAARPGVAQRDVVEALQRLEEDERASRMAAPGACHMEMAWVPRNMEKMETGPAMPALISVTVRR